MKIYQTDYYLCLSNKKDQLTVTPLDGDVIEIEIDDGNATINFYLDMEQVKALRDYLSGKINDKN